MAASIEQTKDQKKNTKKAGPLFSLDGFFSFLKSAFTAGNVIGIDIGSSYIKILQLQKAGKNFSITHCITKAFPQQAKDNVGERKTLLQNLIKEFISDSRVKTKLARVAVSGKGVFIFSLVAPELNKKDLRGLIGLELKKRVPFQQDLNNIIFDFFVTGKMQDEKGQALQITCIAVDRLAIEEQLKLLKEIKLRPMAVNVIPDCLGNLLPYCLELPKDKTITLLDIGANASLLNFYKDKNLMFSREIPVGGEHLTRAMAKPITTASGTTEVSVENAEMLKRNFGIPLEDEAKTEFLTDLGGVRGEQISTLLRPVLERMILEITRTISYYTKTFKLDELIEELYITGGSSRLRNIDKFFLYNLEKIKKVERLNILKSVKGWADSGVLKQELVMEQAAPHLAVAFGLCLGAGGRINLLPAKERFEQQTVFFTWLLKIFFPVVFCFLGIGFALITINNLNYKKLLGKIDSQIGSLEPVAVEVKEYLNMKSRLDQRKELLEKAKGHQPNWREMLKELSNITPPEVTFEKLIALDQKEPKEIRMTGTIVAKYTVIDLALSQYLITLEESPFFSNVELISSQKDMFSPVPKAAFEISCKLVY